MDLMPITRFITRHFIRDLVLVFVLFSAAVFGLVAFFAASARKDISQRTIDHASVGAVRQFESMAARMNQALELAGDWVASGRASLADTAELNNLLFPLLKRDRMLFGISIADTRGDSYYLTAHNHGWRTSQVDDQKSSPLIRHFLLIVLEFLKKLKVVLAFPTKY